MISLILISLRSSLYRCKDSCRFLDKFEFVYKMDDRCNWCGADEAFVEGKRYCATCESNMYRECIRCHKPYDQAKYFGFDMNRCNACQRRYYREKELNKKTSEKTLDSDYEDEDSGFESGDTSIISPSGVSPLKSILENEDLSIFNKKLKNGAKKKEKREKSIELDEVEEEKKVVKKKKATAKVPTKATAKASRKKKATPPDKGEPDLAEVYGLVPLVIKKQKLAVMLDT